MTDSEKKYLDEIWNDLSDEEKKEFNSLSDSRKSVWLRYYSEDEAMAASAERQREKQKNMACRTCKFAGKMFNGRKTTDYTAGSCEKYETKPTGVYFDNEKCPRYQEK